MDNFQNWVAGSRSLLASELGRLDKQRATIAAVLANLPAIGTAITAGPAVDTIAPNSDGAPTLSSLVLRSIKTDGSSIGEIVGSVRATRPKASYAVIYATVSQQIRYGRVRSTGERGERRFFLRSATANKLRGK